MHVRLNIMIGDPAQLGEATRYLAGTVRPHVEAEPGNRGLACLVNADLGVCVVASYWDCAEAMVGSEHSVAVSRKEMAELLRSTVTVEYLEVPVFIRRSHPRPGGGVRITRLETDPANVDDAVGKFRRTARPALMDMPGLASVQLMVDQATGHCLVMTEWEDADALAATRSGAAALRADQAAVTHSLVRSVEEYRLVLSTVRDGDNRSLIERDIELWNARDRAGWLAATDLDRLELQLPGGPRLAGREAADTLWNTWHEAFPDNRLETLAIHADERGGAHEGRFIGTHAGTFRGPASTIAGTGKTVDTRFCGMYTIDSGKITRLHLYFDQLELLAQLGMLSNAA